MFGFFTFELTTHWSNYSDCATPINYWLLGTYLMIPFARILYVVIGTTESFFVFKACIFIAVFFIMPGFISWIILGALWETILNDETPDCIPDDQYPFLTIWWIGLCVFIAIVIIASIIIELIKFKRNRRLLMGHQNMIETGDLFYQHFSAQVLLMSEGGRFKGAGLKRRELKLLDKYTFSYSEKEHNNLNTSETTVCSIAVGDREICSICLNKYANDDKLCLTPGCNHIFHRQCIKQWLSKCPICPYCKSDVKKKLLKKEAA